MTTKKAIFVLMTILLSKISSSQVDTTIYYSQSYATVSSIEEAVSFQVFRKTSKNAFLLASFRKSNWLCSPSPGGRRPKSAAKM